MNNQNQAVDDQAARLNQQNERINNQNVDEPNLQMLQRIMFNHLTRFILQPTAFAAVRQGNEDDSQNNWAEPVDNRNIFEYGYEYVMRRFSNIANPMDYIRTLMAQLQRRFGNQNQGVNGENAEEEATQQQQQEEELQRDDNIAKKEASTKLWLNVILPLTIFACCIIWSKLNARTK